MPQLQFWSIEVQRSEIHTIVFQNLAWLPRMLNKMFGNKSVHPNFSYVSYLPATFNEQDKFASQDVILNCIHLSVCLNVAYVGRETFL
jgi:hypothetical protein